MKSSSQIVPVIGERRLRDCRTGTLDRVVKDRAALGFSPTMLRKVLHGMFAVAVRHDVVASNPVRDVVRISRPRREIEYLDSYQGSVLEVYNTVGQLVYRSFGYNTPWDGTTNGRKLPAGTYYYVLDPKNKRKKMAGYVTIIY